MIKLLPVAAVMCAVASVAAQTTDETLPSFEVASVKVNRSNQPNRMFQPQPGGRFNGVNLRLRDLIQFAYQIRPFQLEGGPDWMDTASFDIVAKAPGDVPPPMPGGPPSPVTLMMRALLADRFKLAVRRETKDAPIYELVLAREDGRLGPRLSPSTTDCAAIMKAAMKPGAPPPPPPMQGDRMLCGGRMGPTRLDMGGFPIDELPNMLGVILQRRVANRTGLTGNYDLTLMFSPDGIPGIPLPAGFQPPPPDPNSPSIFTAVQEQAGLKLLSARGAVDMLIVERAEMPTED